MTTFYDDRFTRRFPLPLLLFEWISKHPPAEDADDELTLAYYRQALRVVGIDNPVFEDVAYVIRRVLDVYEQRKPEGRSSPVRDFGHALKEMLQDFSVEELLLAACGFDYERARKAYCELDRDEALQVIDTWVKLLSHRHNMEYEAAVYGAGGSYKGSGDSQVIDMTKGDVDLDSLNMLFNA